MANTMEAPARDFCSRETEAESEAEARMLVEEAILATAATVPLVGQARWPRQR